MIQISQTKTYGIFYIAIGKKYIEEACQSAKSVKDKMPAMPTAILSNEEITSSYFDQVIVVKESGWNSWIDRLKYVYQSPYDYTLLLDTDTYICDDFSEIFTLLARFDIAASHAPYRISPTDYSTWKESYTIEGVPESFPELNCGIILYKKHPKVEQFFAAWLELYQKQMQGETTPVHDQPAFREALYKSTLRIATLTSEYNCRFVFPVFVSNTVKILHGRHRNLASVAQKINSQKFPRVFFNYPAALGVNSSDKSVLPHSEICVFSLDENEAYSLELEQLLKEIGKRDISINAIENTIRLKLYKCWRKFKEIVLPSR